MPRMYPVHGTKERPSGRQALIFQFPDGRIIVDGIRPADRDEMFARLWAHCGRGNVWVTYRRMKTGERYVEMPELVEGSDQESYGVGGYISC